MISLLELIREIGDSKVEAFTDISLVKTEYTNTNEPQKTVYSFKSDKNNYIVTIEYMGDPKTQLPNKRYYLYIDFKTEEGGLNITKENVPLRIMATVTKIVKDEINRVQNDKKIKTKDKLNIVTGVLFAPADNWVVGKFGVAKTKGASSRTKLYTAYIKQNIPKAKEIPVPTGLKLPTDITLGNVIAFEFPKVSFVNRFKNILKVGL